MDRILSPDHGAHERHRISVPITKITPGIVVGTISMVVLAIAILARYAFHTVGAWARTYVITAAIALYLNCFVLIAQSFEKVPALNKLAPTQIGATIPRRPNNPAGALYRAYRLSGKTISRNRCRLRRKLSASRRLIACNLLLLQKRPLLQFLKCVAQLFLRVHHNGPVPRHWLLQWLARNQKKPNPIFSSLHRDLVAPVKKNQ